MRVGQARKRDWNERAIIRALRSIGVVVIQVSGTGAPDLLCYHRGSWLAVEVKKPKGRLTDAQLNTRVLAPFPVVSSVPEALKLFGINT